MNESEYLNARIKYLKKIISNPDIPQNVKMNQQQALINYKAELRKLNSRLF